MIRDEDKEKHSKAKVLVNQLVFVLETRRRHARNNAAWSKRVKAHTSRVVELATGSGMAINPYPSLLPVSWFSDVEELQKAQKRTQELESRLQQFQSNLDQAAQAFDALVSSRTQILLDAPDDDQWPQTAQQLEQEISAANDDLNQIEANITLVQAGVDSVWLDDEAATQSILETAEAGLIKIGLMRPSKKAELDTADEGLAQTGQIRQNDP